MNKVRIIGGDWRRRLIEFPDSEGLRPTPDRVRETLFNWLGQTLDGEICLDLFAGSGALGFEAASRGAGKVVMVEQNARVAAALAKNIDTLQAASRVELKKGDALQYLASATPIFDLVLLDPPFHKDWLARLVPLLTRVMAPDGAVYVEAEHEIDSLGSWRVVRHGRAGVVHFHLLRQESS